MSDFKTVCESFSNLDPYKRVNYVNGLVLGADEFVQEQGAFFLLEVRLHTFKKRMQYTALFVWSWPLKCTQPTLKTQNYAKKGNLRPAHIKK